MKKIWQKPNNLLSLQNVNKVLKFIVFLNFQNTSSLKSCCYKHISHKTTSTKTRIKTCGKQRGSQQRYCTSYRHGRCGTKTFRCLQGLFVSCFYNNSYCTVLCTTPTHFRSYHTSLIGLAFLFLLRELYFLN